MLRRRRPPAGDDDLQIPGLLDAELIGRGGFSKVYTAFQERLARTVAVKVVTAELTPEAERRFDREQRTAGQLDGHPNVIRIYGSGLTESGQAYLMMEYHPMGSLADRVRRHGPLPVDEALQIGEKLAGALDVAHRRSIIHRDVKPQNVLTSQFGEPVLADFGIAAIDPERFTVTTEAFSVNHAAPEVLSGEPATTSSDLYSLVSTLYELLAGRPAFADPDRNELLALIRRVQSDPIPPITRPDVPREVDEGLRDLMSRDPASRPATAADLADRLRSLRHVQPGDAHASERPAGATGRSPWAAPATFGEPQPVVEAAPTEQDRAEPLGDEETSADMLVAGSAAASAGSGSVRPAVEEPSTVMRPRVPEGAPEPLTGSAVGKRRWPWLVAVAAVVTVLGVASFVLFRVGDETQPAPGPAPTTTADLASFGACPDAATEIPDTPYTSSVAPEDVEVEALGDGTSVRISWSDTNEGQGYYVVLSRCDAADGRPVPVSYNPPGSDSAVTVDGLEVDGNYCFSVGALPNRTLSDTEEGSGLVLGTDSSGDTSSCLLPP